MGEKGEGSGGKGGGKWGERGRELGMGYPPVHPLINIEHKQIPKTYFNMMRIIMAHNILKGFCYLAVLISNSSKNGLYIVKALNLVKNGNFSILSLFHRPFLLP